MKRSRKLGRRSGKWITTLLCAAMIAPLTGCSPALLGFTMFNALFFSFVNFLPLRAAIGTGIRDVVVSIF